MGAEGAPPSNHPQLLPPPHTVTLRYAAFALSNLAANANHRQQIVDDGGPEALVALACCEDLNAQRQALAALRGLCISPQYRTLVVRQGILHVTPPRDPRLRVTLTSTSHSLNPHLAYRFPHPPFHTHTHPTLPTPLTSLTLGSAGHTRPFSAHGAHRRDRGAAGSGGGDQLPHLDGGE